MCYNRFKNIPEGAKKVNNIELTTEEINFFIDGKTFDEHNIGIFFFGFAQMNFLYQAVKT